MTKRQNERIKSLLPGGQPRWIRAYDNGGTDVGGSIDRYTVLYTGRYPKSPGRYQYVAMDESPFHPQGFGQHGESQEILDQRPGRWGGVAIGRTHPTLGKRIAFNDLPQDCRKLVVQDYREIWHLPATATVPQLQ